MALRRLQPAVIIRGFTDAVLSTLSQRGRLKFSLLAETKGSCQESKG